MCDRDLKSSQTDALNNVVWWMSLYSNDNFYQLGEASDINKNVKDRILHSSAIYLELEVWGILTTCADGCYNLSVWFFWQMRERNENAAGRAWGMGKRVD